MAIANVDVIPAAEILDGITGSTPLHEMIGGPGASVPADQLRKRRGGHPPKYILTDEIKDALARYDGTAASLNKLTVELGVPRNKLIDWLAETGLVRRGGRGKRLQPTAAVTGAQPEPEPEETPPARIAEVQPAPPPAKQQQPAESGPERIALDDWLMSGAEGVWFAGSIAVQPLCQDEPNSYAILIAHPSVPRVPGPVPGHLVSYLVRALVRKSHVTGIVYR